jgi:hypothetical protein
VSTTDHRRERQTKAAKNQALFREINERVKDLNEGFSLVAPVGEWLCECANDTCTERVSMTADEYEAIRQEATRFFVAPDDEHVWPDVELVIERRESYWVVEKIDEAARIARQTDPRGDGPLPLRT